jgi:hypothetical protein
VRRIVAGLVLLLSLIAGAAPAQAEWRRAVSTHFVIYSEAADAELRGVAERLERFDGVMRRLTPVSEDSEAKRLTIYMPRTISAVQDMMGGTVGGFYISDLAGPFAVAPRQSMDFFAADIVLFHEYVHHFMLQYFSTAYPPWFVEGYAELFSNTRFEQNGSIVVGAPAEHRAGSLRGEAPPLRSILFPDREHRLPGDQFYANAWMLTHYLLISEERPGQLHRYVGLLGAGRPPEAAAEEAFGGLASLEHDFRRYRRALRIPALRLRFDQAPATGSVAIETLSPGEERLIWLEVDYRREPAGERLQSLVRRVRARAAETPNDPDALQLLADVESLADHPDEAGRAIDAVLALRPAAPRALLRKGVVEAALLERAHVTDPARWTAAREWIRRANRASPDDAKILFEYYHTFERQGIRPPAPAVVALERACELVPQSFDLRLRLGREFVFARRYRDAVEVLSPVAYSAHGGWRSEAAQRIIDLVRPLADGAEPPPAALAPPVPPAEEAAR